MKKGVNVLFVVMFVLLALSLSEAVGAVDFSINVEPVKDHILVTDSAEFQITILNEKGVTDHINFKPLEDLRFTPQSVPTFVVPSGIDVDLKDRTNFTLFIKPDSALTDGVYTLALHAESEFEDKTVHQVIRIYIGDHESMYEPEVKVRPQIQEKIDPRNRYTLKINLENKNAIPYEELKVKIEGAIINQETTTTLGPRESKILDIPVDLPHDAKPRVEKIRITVTGRDTQFLQEEYDLNILPYSEPFEKNEEVEKKFLKTIRSVSLTNEANNKEVKRFTLGTTMRERLLTNTEPDAEYERIDGKLYYVWDIELQPGEEATITVTKSYRLLTLILILVLVGIVYYFQTRSPLTIRKEVVKAHYDKGALVGGQIRLFLRNRTGNTVSNGKIVEHLPSMMRVNQHDFGHSLKPDKIFQSTRGPVMEYHLSTINPHEERIITYSFKAKLNVVGNQTIAPTKVKFKDHQGYSFSIASNGLVIEGKE